MNEAEIITKKNVELSQTQEKLIISGWGAESFNNTVVESIVYMSDGLKVKGYVAYPVKSGKYPSIVWCRGGIGDSGAIDEFNARGMFGKLASWGYVVFAPQYRGNSNSEGIDEFGGSDVNDITNIMEIAKSYPQADTDIWGIEGWSRGGLMTYLMLTKSDKFKAAIILGGISNVRNAVNTPLLFKRIQELSDNSFGLDDFNSLINKRSVINFVQKLNKETPMLIIHGNKDDRVLVKDPIELSTKLLENENIFRLVLLEGGDHFLKTHRNEVDEMRKKWYKKYLG